jgi:hypothetical protein
MHWRTDCGYFGGERVLMARRCRKRAAEWMKLAETAIMAEERNGHLIVAEHYSALAEAAEY